MSPALAGGFFTTAGLGWQQLVKCAKNVVSCVSQLGSLLWREQSLCVLVVYNSVGGDKTDTYKILTSSKNQDMNQKQMMEQWLSGRSARGISGGVGAPAAASWAPLDTPEPRRMDGDEVDGGCSGEEQPEQRCGGLSEQNVLEQQWRKKAGWGRD